ncbi:MAG: hypothetical protein K2X27_25425, partial [Candidatus Obscuribacterales bacterium]|nr:hypothetical protein [Candidatus Obscuribacterales bacterium]
MEVGSVAKNLGQLSYARIATASVLVAIVAAAVHVLSYFLARFGFIGESDTLRDLINDVLLIVPMFCILNNWIFRKAGTSMPTAFALRTPPASAKGAICIGFAGNVFSLVLLAGLIAVLILMNFDLDHWSS